MSYGISGSFLRQACRLFFALRISKADSVGRFCGRYGRSPRRMLQLSSGTLKQDRKSGPKRTHRETREAVYSQRKLVQGGNQAASRKTLSRVESDWAKCVCVN